MLYGGQLGGEGKEKEWKGGEGRGAEVLSQVQMGKVELETLT